MRSNKQNGLEPIKVTVICITYNHAPYIKKTLDSFLMQKTNFRFKVIVRDDASNDGTADIVKEYEKKYPDVIKGIYQKENKYQKGIRIDNYIFPHIEGEYIASCEGDDYWTNENMLQHEFDFLNNNKDYVAVGGVTRYFDDDGKEILSPRPKKRFLDKELTKFEYYTNNNVVATSTIMYRKQIISDKRYIKAKAISTKIGDILLCSSLFECGKVFILGEYYQYHRIQTRKSASNFNSIYSYKNKYYYSIVAINSIYNNICHETIIKAKIRRHTALFFCYCILNFRIGDFFECYSYLEQNLREPILKILVLEIPKIIFDKVKDYLYCRSVIQDNL